MIYCEMAQGYCRNCCPMCGGCQQNSVCEDAEYEEFCPEGASCPHCGEDVEDCEQHFCDDDDEGQPSEYEEWQDYMGGDDWDHGQYD